MYPSLPHFLRRHIDETRHWRDKEKKPRGDPRINDLGRAIQDDFATIRDNYGQYFLSLLLGLANICSNAKEPNCPRTRAYGL
jgi:hypothetical protein